MASVVAVAPPVFMVTPLRPLPPEPFVTYPLMLSSGMARKSFVELSVCRSTVTEDGLKMRPDKEGVTVYDPGARFAKA